MKNKFEHIHTVTVKELHNNPNWNMPYVPAIKVLSGKPVYISGVNAAPIYHSHPHNPKEFEEIDPNPSNQARLTMENLKTIVHTSGGTLNDIVQLFIFIVDVVKNGDAINKIISSYFGDHLFTSTVIGINNLITDPKLVVEITAVAYVEY
jgi:enamine deaminase RidA (YjgF/YER057c/UK114 family)